MTCEVDPALRRRLLLRSTTIHSAFVLSQEGPIMKIDRDSLRKGIRATTCAALITATLVLILLPHINSQITFAADPPAESNQLPILVRGLGDTSTGVHVEYAPMLGPDPADEVVSARVELYYFRNAHRVAQILNRNVKSHNTTAVTAAEQAAKMPEGVTRRPVLTGVPKKMRPAVPQVSYAT